MVSPNPYPGLLTDIELLSARVDEIQLPLGELAMKTAITLQGRAAIGAAFHDPDPSELPLVIEGSLGLEGLDYQPLVGVGLPYL